MADLMSLAKIETTMLIREPHFWSPTLDEVSGGMIEDAITKSGIKFLKDTEIVEVTGGDSVDGVTLKDGTHIDCEMIMCGIGVMNNTKWLADSGVAVNRGILANEYLETNVPDIYVAGDIAEYKDLLLEENVIMGNWVNAVEQGRTCAKNMLASSSAKATAGQDKEPFRFVSFYTTQGFGISIAFVGDVAFGKDRVVISRGSKESNSYAQVVIVGKELVGATMINRTGELTTFAKLIKNNVDVSGKHTELADSNFDLKTLIQ